MDNIKRIPYFVREVRPVSKFKRANYNGRRVFGAVDSFICTIYGLYEYKLATEKGVVHGSKLSDGSIYSVVVHPRYVQEYGSHTYYFEMKHGEPIYHSREEVLALRKLEG